MVIRRDFCAAAAAAEPDSVRHQPSIGEMPRIPKSNPRHRTKATICEDVATVLKSSLSHGTKHAVLAEVVWVWSEFDGKYTGCRHWSRAAVAARAAGEKARSFVHEHVVPKRIIIERLFALPSPVRAADVERVLSTLCIGAVLTREEDRRLTESGLRSGMPGDIADFTNPWARYAAVGIEMQHPVATVSASR
jgi:hypothetical protein